MTKLQQMAFDHLLGKMNISMRRKILLGLTGSVATVLYEKLVEKLQSIGDVSVVLTENAEHFVPNTFDGVKVFREQKEWQWFRDGKLTDKWRRNDPILHINLRDKYSAFVIAPCSLNTLAKLSAGICDNLLTSIARAWDFNRPIIVAPAGNTHMWNHPVTEQNINMLCSWGYTIVNPQSKMLACGTEGMGALADIDEIVKATREALQWVLPMDPDEFSGIPVGDHPGAFACQRKHEKHTGVDLYCKDDTDIRAVESGIVVGIEHFTGEWDNSPWWNNTDCVLIEGPTGVVCYGEIEPVDTLKVGDSVAQGEYIADVRQVLKEGKHRHDIPGHSTSMLHMELYPHGTVKASNGFEEKLLNDITPFLLEAVDADKVTQLIYNKECS